jgi:esterase/lipase superfamily enzyme
MAEETSFHPIRWVQRFMRTDAEQPVGTARMALSALRTNQWVLLEWKKLRDKSQFYVFKKKELLPRLEHVAAEVSVVNALSLRDSPPSQAFENRPVGLFTSSQINPEQSWLPRKVLLGPDGRPVAIGVPVIPRETFVLHTYLRPRQPPLAEHREKSDATGPSGEAPRDYCVVRIFYGTDRLKVGNQYSNRREPTDSLHFGTCEVTIPRDHRLASLESPKWWKFEFSWNPEKHVVLQQINQLPKAEFVAQLRSNILESENKSAFVFIHGYDVSFEDAARRTAQLSYDLGFKGAPILYSWPSANSLKSYLADEATIDWTKPHLVSFLHDVASMSGADRVHIIAHSMGNRALVRILDGLSLPSAPPYFNQVVLAAPDIDTGEFVHLASSIQRTASRITLYASSNDKAIKASKAIHEYPRAGESVPEVVVVPGLDTIDATNVDTSLLGHSYFAEKRTVISDLFYLIGEGKGPDERHSLEPKYSTKGQYWAFKA